MTQSIATLGIKVASQGIAEADRDLGKLQQTGAKVEAQAAKTARGMQQTALSAKQLQAATRGLPAQFTDIATALGSGQRPLQVLLQQGGQLKDMFGGVGPAIRATGTYIAGLVTPVTVLAAASVGLFAAWRSGVEDARQLRNSLILTGNAAGTTATDLARMAQDLDKATNATAGSASRALAEVNATGKFTAEQLRIVTEAAINMESATGKAIGDTVKEFVALANDPVEAILKLNDAQNFLTSETLAQIDSLKKQGREAAAAEVAIKAYASTINSRAGEVADNLDLWARMWGNIKRAGAEALDEVKSGISSLDAAVLAHMPTMERYLSMIEKGTGSGFIRGAIGNIRANAKQLSDALATQGVADGFAPFMRGGTVNSQQERARRKEAEEAAQFEDRYLSRAQQKTRELADLERLKANYTAEQYANLKKQIELRYQDPKGRTRRPASTTGVDNARDRFNDMVGRFQAELDGPLQQVEQNHLRNMRELEQAAKAGKVAHSELAAALEVEGRAYAKASEEVRNRLDAEVASLSGPVAQAQSDHEAALRRIEELKLQGAATGAQYNAMIAEEARVFGLAAREAERAADPIGALLDDMAFELDMIGRLNSERAVMNELRRQEIPLMSAEAQAALGVARAYEEEAQRKQVSIDLMDRFRSEASNALSDFVTGAKSAKEAFTDFFDSIAQAITKAIADQWIQQLFGAQGTMGQGTGGGNFLGSILSMFGFGGFRANGGPTQAGKAYIVGERGPELFVPSVSGSVVSNRQIAGGGTTINQVINVPRNTEYRSAAQVGHFALMGAQRAAARNR